MLNTMAAGILWKGVNKQPGAVVTKQYYLVGNLGCGSGGSRKRRPDSQALEGLGKFRNIDCGKTR